MGMTNTEFIVRQRHEPHPLFRTDRVQFRAVDGVMILGLLAAFLGLVLLLSK